MTEFLSFLPLVLVGVVVGLAIGIGVEFCIRKDGGAYVHCGSGVWGRCVAGAIGIASGGLGGDDAEGRCLHLRIQATPGI